MPNRSANMRLYAIHGYTCKEKESIEGGQRKVQTPGLREELLFRPISDLNAVTEGSSGGGTALLNG